MNTNALVLMTALVAVLEKNDLAYTIKRSGDYRKVDVTRGEDSGVIHYGEDGLAALGPKDLMQPIGDELAQALRGQGVEVRNESEAEAQH
jgi:hypothetical protein